MSEPTKSKLRPSNADIYSAIGGLKAEVKEIRKELVEVRLQTTRTNGRVTRLENRNERADDRVKWEKEQSDKVLSPIPTLTTTPEGQKVDFTKIILGLIGLSASLVALAQFIASQQQ
jgi:chromosome segregation ATPase